MEHQDTVCHVKFPEPRLLLEKLKQMEAVLDSIDNPVGMLDKHFCVQYANKATKANFHLPSDQI